MYVASSAPIPQNSMSAMQPTRRASYNGRKQRVMQSVALAISRYDCAAPPESFPGFGMNFQYQVQRAAHLVNSIGSSLVPTTKAVQKSVSSTGTSAAPKITPLSGVNPNPIPKVVVPPVGSWDTPVWGNAATQWPGICTPGTSFLNALQNHPWWALGGLAAILLAGGVIGVGVKRRRARRRAA